MTSDEASFLGLLGYIYMENDRPEKAAVLFAALNQLYPDVPRTLRALAFARVQSGKAEAALDALDRLAMAGGVDAAFHLLRAQALGALGRTGEAASAMRAYLQLRAATPVLEKES